MDCVTIEVVRRDKESWGIQLSGEGPCYIESIQDGSPAEEAKLEVGDFLISVNGVSVYNTSHDQVVRLIADCGKIARFRILPDESRHCSGKQVENPQQLIEKKKDPEPFQRNQQSSSKKSYDLQIHYEKLGECILSPNERKQGECEVDQRNFIVTRENQIQFDEHFEHEGNFVGEKATVAGAFTGDFNVIRGNKENDVIGIRSRVLAGIQHFSFVEKGQKVDDTERGKIILYTTSLGIHRSVAYKCQEARKTLQAFRVKFEDRDIFANLEYKEELYRKLGLSVGDPFPNLPRLYIDGVFVGDYDQLQEMSDCGDLRIRLQSFPKYNIRKHCPTCNATGFITCSSCNGKSHRQKNRFKTLKCGSCKQKGKTDCPDCF